MSIVSEYNPVNFKNVLLGREKILDFFVQCRAYWRHDNIFSSPHAAIGGDKCSNIFFDCARVLRHDNLREILAHQLIKRMWCKKLFEKQEINYIVGVPYHLPSSPTFRNLGFSARIAKQLKVKHGFCHLVRNGFAEKAVWEGEIPEKAGVFLVKEVVFEKEAETIRRAINRGNKCPINVLPSAGAIIYFAPNGPVVGEQAKARRKIDAENVVQLFKRNIDNEHFLVGANGRDYTPVDLSALLLTYLKDLAA